MIKNISLLIKKFTEKKISYSYGGIDSLIIKIFKNKRNGFYVDLGCGNPIKNNNTYQLHRKFNWSGINIDLDKDNIKLFEISRPADENVIAAVSDSFKETNLFFYHSKSSLNTISKVNAEYQKAKVNKSLKVNTITLNSILEKSKFNTNEIDFLSIDVEGSELPILKNLNFKKYNAKVIVVEYLDLSLPVLEIKNLKIENIINSELYQFMISNNYSLANVLHSDLVFINNNFRD
jgi:FkbM family methyltransferase